MAEGRGGVVLSIGAPGVVTCTSEELGQRVRRSLRALFAAGWPEPEHAFDEHDWEHMLGGTHFLLLGDGEPIAHAAVVRRQLEAGGVPLATGYVEAVATAPPLQRRGLGTRVMQAVNAHIDAGCELGALGTGVHAFYEPLGWRVWRGPTGVRTREGVATTPEDDGHVLVRTTPQTPALDPAAPLVCDWRAGDVW